MSKTDAQIIEDLKDDNARLRSERPYVVGWNAGFSFATSAHENPEEQKHSIGAADIARERERQMLVEGWTAEGDDRHTQCEMADAARCYLEGSMWGWPSGWDKVWWKPKDRRANLVRAGALIAAEIDRIDRKEGEK